MVVEQIIDVPASRRITLEVPREIPAGPVIVTFTPQKAEPEPKKEREFGCLKGQIWMAEDFDAPLEEFKDYM